MGAEFDRQIQPVAKALIRHAATDIVAWNPR
jgi:hypothetical protein